MSTLFPQLQNKTYFWDFLREIDEKTQKLFMQAELV